MKKCNRCQMSKDDSFFGTIKYKTKKGIKTCLRYICRQCDVKKHQEIYIKFPRKIKTKEQKKEAKKIYENKYKEYFNKIKRDKYKNNKTYRDHRILRDKKWRDKNPNKVKEHRKKYKSKHRIEINIYHKRKLKEDIQYKLKSRLRTRLCLALKKNQKQGSAIKDLGCSIEDLKIWLEQQFQPGMTWENYGNKEGQWSIDHIIPLSSFDLTDRKQFLKANHWFNLQPLWHIQNMRKNKFKIKA